ncbi:MAG: Zn-dependent hydrolase [Candidatus Aminicenantes bacterium]|nr:Zn-dependent hydrolase [Candidatus Aminicenantes bacterium]
MWEKLRINEDRFHRDFEALAKIGATSDGGVDRPAFSPAHSKARQWFLQRAAAAGLKTNVDSAGNHSALYPCGRPKAQVVLLGSHLDSVPSGGRFDGALGVLAALEVLRTVKENGLRFNTDLEAVDFTDEEGRFLGFLGSRALTGNLKTEDLSFSTTTKPTFRKALNSTGLTPESILSAARNKKTLSGYLELHIEQGPVLEAQKKDIGIVTGITGILSFSLTFTGIAGHAGTFPMEKRKDAGWAAASFILAVRRILLNKFPGCTATVGKLHLEPGAVNVIPRQAVLSLEFRAGDRTTLEKLESVLLSATEKTVRRYGTKLDIVPMEKTPPVPTSSIIQKTIQKTCRCLGLSSLHMTSGAGHDAQILARICPAGLIFIPSIGGISHSPRENTRWKDCVNGANILLQTALSLAETKDIP